MTVLVDGGAVELTVGYMTEVGLDIPRYPLEMFAHFTVHDRARVRISAPGVVDRVKKWFGKWFPHVRAL
jgi:hypothetical protein